MEKLLFKLALFIIKSKVEKVVSKTITDAVVNVEKELSYLASEDKRKEAIKRIKKSPDIIDKEVKNSTINLLIETIVQSMKM